jgi:hypothetical protein
MEESMRIYFKGSLAVLAVVFIVVFVLGYNASAQGNAGSIQGVVKDPQGAVVAGATVEISNPVSGYQRETVSQSDGSFRFVNVPFDHYHTVVTAKGFGPAVQDVEVRSNVPVAMEIGLKLAESQTVVEVTGEREDLLNNTSTFQQDIDRTLIDKIPLESISSQVSSIVTLSTPGIAADSNGLFHGIGDHAENSFSVDGQPITDQQSKVFSNQIPLDSVQSLEVISGAPPAEFGDKTSVVIKVTTRSGQGGTTPHGEVNTSYGSFGTSTGGFNLAYGGAKWGNFISADGTNTGRFLDPPEFTVMHDKGNEENIFDRIDYQFSTADAVHLDLDFSRSWFQTPNSFDAQDATPWNGLNGMLPAVENYGGIAPNGDVVGATDQRSKILTYNIAPTWTHLMGTDKVFSLGAYVRRDGYDYYPSKDPFADLGPPSLQRESVGQYRTLTNMGLRSDFSYAKGINNIKVGAMYEQTLLQEDDTLGIVDPALNAPCIAAVPVNAFNANPFAPVPGFTDPSQCLGAGLQPNIASNANAPNTPFYPAFNPVLAPFDLTRGGSLFAFDGHTDVKELALYVQDMIIKGNWAFNVGIRGDLYNGITTGSQAEPRLGISYNIKPSGTVLRISYARTMETPFNENLILSSIGCANPVLNPLLLCSSTSTNPLSIGFRNEFHAGFEQAWKKYLVFSGEWISKYTHNGFDFSVLGNTPITFPIEWHNSKIPGYAGRLSVPNHHGFQALMVFSSVAARFFTPQIAGAGATPTAAVGPFRIDHDEHFNLTAHFQYQPWKRWPWLGFNWRYDSGLVAGATPCFGALAQNDCPQSLLIGGVPNVSMIAANVGGVPLSADQEFEAGFFCGSQHATPTSPLPFNCAASQFGSTLISVPNPNQENDDHNPPRIDQHNLVDLAVGHDNIFRGDRYKVSAQLTVVNLANQYALYNFLSTFSGTHYITPRSITGEIGLHF